MQFQRNAVYLSAKFCYTFRSIHQFLTLVSNIQIILIPYRFIKRFNWFCFVCLITTQVMLPNVTDQLLPHQKLICVFPSKRLWCVICKQFFLSKFITFVAFVTIRCQQVNRVSKAFIQLYASVNLSRKL